MIVVVGFDLTAAGDQALLDASEALGLSDDASSSLHVVHVVDQKQLDATGALDAAGKKQRALDRLYPEVWRRVKDLATRMPFGLPNDVAVDIGFAAVHAVRTHEEIARRLLGVTCSSKCTRSACSLNTSSTSPSMRDSGRRKRCPESSKARSAACKVVGSTSAKGEGPLRNSTDHRPCQHTLPTTAPVSSTASCKLGRHDMRSSPPAFTRGEDAGSGRRSG